MLPRGTKNSASLARFSIMSAMGYALARKSKAALPQIPFKSIKREVLGSSYDLSFVWAPPALTRTLNRRYRKKDKPANVLSFPISKNSGEIFITPTVAKKDAKQFGFSYNEFIALLFIHGLLHLKGLTHGSTMDKSERKLLSRFGYAHSQPQNSRTSRPRGQNTGRGGHTRTSYGKTNPRNRH